VTDPVGVAAVVPTVEELMANHAGSIRDLGILTTAVGDTLTADMEVLPELWFPGSDVVRTSVLVTLADIVAGKLANASTFPRVCVTLDLDLHLLAVPGGVGFEVARSLTARSWVVRAGQRIVVMGVEMFDADGHLFAVGNAGFMASPNPAHEIADGFPLDTSDDRFRLDMPFADRVGARRTGNGTATVPFHLDNINATGAIQGGLLALAAEEALADLHSGGAASPPIESISVRYLRGFRGSAANAAARIDGTLGRVEVVDDEGRVGTLVTVRFAPV
jgi:acyl-coenzyme A thioesterase PaaI-like protein